MIMPIMNGNQLVEAIRKESYSQKIMILTGLNDFNEMKDVINLGIDGIMLKPFQEKTVFPILLRVLSMLKAKKLLKQQYLQLKFLSQENVELKSNAHIHSHQVENKTKYKIRTSYNNTKHQVSDFYEALDYTNIDNADQLMHDFDELEGKLFHLFNEKNITAIEHTILESLLVFNHLGEFMSNFRDFELAGESAFNLINFIRSLDFSLLEDVSKKELFMEIYFSIIEDSQQWLKIIFTNNDQENINYFDASFANSCLELEAIFTNIIEEETGELEFF